ncbi:hypothetical protein RA307_00710 [Xanthobacteraceae bacterium Astr-EGSB]|uniref:hypothetical protein n=1 Tax=Astrobacterium formosum TaxID=3069710 RepID=UPI0027AFF232|nr:hypothetical protein [Xanthobacteraceae bacterium Astr-EGSB]
MSTHDEFLAYAETCRRLMDGGDLRPHRADLERMARAWTSLAAEEERIADLVREVDTLFAAPETMDRMLRRASH